MAALVETGMYVAAGLGISYVGGLSRCSELSRRGTDFERSCRISFLIFAASTGSWTSARCLWYSEGALLEARGKLFSRGRREHTSLML